MICAACEARRLAMKKAAVRLVAPLQKFTGRKPAMSSTVNSGRASQPLHKGGKK